MALRRFAATVARRRKRARNDARAAVASARFVRLILAAGALAAARHVDAARSAASAWLAAPPREFARTLLARRRRKLLRYGERLAQATAEDRHAVRIAAKKLRYATEFFVDLFGKKRARPYRAALMQLQDTLGALNDASVAARVAREIAGPASTTAATLQGWVAAQSVQADALAAAWRDFSRCKPFWERG
jgi:CHAD domain-containing protein